MWKTIILCASLFASAALGLVTAARWMEPAALPTAIGLCVVGVILILIAPLPARLATMEEKATLDPEPSLH